MATPTSDWAPSAGDASLAGQLFTWAADLAGALIPGRPGERADGYFVLDELAKHPLVRAYSLLRMGVWESIEALLPSGDGAGEPAWHPSADIFAVLNSARACLKATQTRRLGIFYTERGQVPVLEELARNLAGRGSTPEAARKELLRYWERIQHLGDFLGIYPLILDLQAAYPHLFGAVAEA